MRRRSVVPILMLAALTGACIRYTPVGNRAAGGKNRYHSASPGALSEHIRTVLRTSGENTPARDEALAQLHSKRTDLADLARRVLEDKDDVSARRTLAQAYLEAQLYADALTLYHQIQDLSPGEATAELGIARIWDHWQDYALAYHHAKEAVRLQPDSAAALEMLGRICLHRNDPAGAISAFSAALRIAPDSADLLANTGYAYLLRSDWQNARRYLEAALAIEPMMQEACNNLGIALANLGDSAGALQQFSAVQPPAAAFNNLGTVYLAQNRLAEARKQFLVALEIEPGYEKARANLAEVESLLPPETVYAIPKRIAESAEPPGTSTPVSSPSAVSPMRPYSLQVYSSHSREAAEAECRRLLAVALPAMVVRADLKDKGIWYRVRLATRAGLPAVLNTARRLVAAGLIRNYWVVREG